MENDYNIVGATVQSGLAKTIRELARRHEGDLHISGGSMIHFQVRLPVNQTENFIAAVNSAACGSIHWNISQR